VHLRPETIVGDRVWLCPFLTDDHPISSALSDR
jgi:hypothetical protein